MLANRYGADLRVYTEAAQLLAQSVETNFHDAFRRSNHARLRFEKAREQLNEHIGRHECPQGPAGTAPVRAPA